MGGGFRISYEKEREEKTFVSLTLTHYYFMRVAAELLWNWKMVAMVAMEKNVHLHIVWCVGRESMDPCPRL